MGASFHVIVGLNLSAPSHQFFDSHFNINVKGPLFLTQLAAPLIPEGNLIPHCLYCNLFIFTPQGGRVIFFSSSLTRASAVPPNALVYAASKAAVEQFTRVLAKDLGAKGITVNTILPGPVDTELFRQGKTQQTIDFIKGTHPAKRIGQVDEISPVVAFLAGPGASWINGQQIPVNGVSLFLLLLAPNPPLKQTH